ncbi:PAS domain S-box protein [Saccharicrinis sp. 156]|uniref:PAS domain S-box protein n=1 Tax=Saccharicrinis sp. 156 TaxID=3417574 RepID=UPI003D3592C2
MQHDNNKSDKFETLRQRAEELIKHQPVGTNADSADMLELIHELKVQQIELELQNEELRQSRQEISDLQLEYENLYEFASCGYITINAKGIITRANLMTVTLLQTERRYLLHSGFSHFIVPGWEGAYHETLKESIKTGEKQRIELPLQINDNPPAWVLAEIEADCDDSGKLHRWRMMLIDITLRKQSEAINIKNKEELDAIYKNAPVLLMLIDKDRRIKKINKYGEKYIGASSHDLIGLRGGEAIRCIHHLDHPKGCGVGPSCVQCPIRNRVMDTFEKGITHEMKEASLPLLINGEEKEATFLISTALLSLKEEPEVMVSIVDITERKRMEKALRESEDRYRSLFNNSTIAVSITSFSGKVLKVNDKMSEISGYSHEELQTVTTDKVYVDYNDRKKLLEIIEQQGKADDFECRIKAKSGKLYWAHMSVKKIIYGGEDALLTSMLNITKLKETEKSLKESEERYRTIFDNAPIGFHIRDLSHRMIDANPASYHMHGYSRDEFLSLDIHQYIGKNLLEKLTQITGKIQEGKSTHVYGTNVRKDGTEFSVEVKVVPIHLYGKRHMLTIIQDISDRVKAEEELRESNEKFIRLYKKSPTGIMIVGMDGTILDYNHDTTIMGLSREEVIGKKYSMLNLSCKKNLNDIFNQLSNGDTISFECESELPSGNVITLKVYTTAITYEGKNSTMFTMQDVTKRKIAEDALQWSNALLRATGQVARVGGWELIAETLEVRWTEETYHIHEVPPDCKHSLQESINFYHPEERKRLSKAIQDALKNGKPFNMELRFITARGNPLWIRSICKPQIKDGKVVKLLGAFQDITELKKTEENLLRKTKQLQSHTRHLQSVREEERTAIAREIHDEFGQVLAALNMNLSTIEREIKDKNKPVDRQGILTELKESKNVLTTAINDVKKMITELRPQVLDVFGVIPAIQRHLDEFGRRNRVRTDFSSNIDRIDFDKDSNIALFRIVQEVLTNVAKHAKASRVNMVIKKSKKYLTLTISDNGAGFDLNVREQKQSFGLLGMEERVLLLNGELKIKSEAGQGTNIWIKIPLPGKPH